MGPKRVCYSEVTLYNLRCLTIILQNDLSNPHTKTSGGQYANDVHYIECVIVKRDLGKFFLVM